MNLADRIQATIRVPAYQEEFQRLFHLFQEKFGDEEEPASKEFIRHLLATYPTLPEVARFAEKWQLPTAIDPDFRGNPERLAPWLTEATAPRRNTARPIQVKVGRPKRHLYLKIDLLERTDVLCALFHTYVQTHQRALLGDGSKARRGKHPDLDPWEIYDLIEVQGKKKYHILRDLWEQAGKNPKEINPAYNAESKQLYKKIGSAYHKAQRCLKAITPLTP